jgi:hypothetical protein
MVRNSILGTLPGKLSRDFPCEGAKFHSPRPLIVAEVILAGGRKANLCGVCRDNLLVLRELLNKYDGSLPWDVRREFGNRLRSLVPMGKPEGTEIV